MNTNPNFRYVDTQEYVDILKNLLRENKLVRVPISGNSMSPFLITNRDSVLLQSPTRPLKKGDVVIFQRHLGNFILHRIYKIKNREFYLVGDAQTLIEGPIRREQIFGLVIKAQRKGAWIDEKDRWWRFFQYVWIRIIPLRPIIQKIYGIVAIPHSRWKLDE